MTVPVNDRIAGPYTATGGETVLAFDFRILAAADLAVWRRRGGGSERLVLNTDYSVPAAGVNNAAGGTVVLVVAAVAADVYVIEGDRPQARTSDLVYARQLPPVTMNGELDSLEIQIAELASRVRRALSSSRFDALGSNTLELPPAEAGKYVGFDDDLNLTLLDGGGGGGGSVPDPLPVAMGGTGGDTAGEARANLGLGTLATLNAVGSEFTTAGSVLRFAGILPDMSRISLQSGVAVTDADITGVSQGYVTPLDSGSLVTLYNGTGWENVALAEQPFYATVIKSCSSSGLILSAIDDTSSLIAGMVVEGDGIQAGTTIASVLSSTSVQLSLSALAASTASRVFKLPANSNVDVCLKLVSGVAVPRFGPLWTNGQTRATALAKQNGVPVLAGDPTRRVIGTIRTTSIAGLLADSRLQRFVSNLANPVRRAVEVRESASSWNYNVNAFRQVNARTANQVECLFTVPRSLSLCATMVASVNNVNAPFAAGIGLNTAIADTLTLRKPGFSAVTNIPTSAEAYLEATPGTGYHYATWLERTFGGLVYTIFGTGAAAGLQPYMQTGMAGVIEA